MAWDRMVDGRGIAVPIMSGCGVFLREDARQCSPCSCVGWICDA